MRYAETGYNLEIDLSRGNIERHATDPRDTELYLGGLGTNAKILWDRVPPGIEGFSPDNLLILPVEPHESFIFWQSLVDRNVLKPPYQSIGGLGEIHLKTAYMAPEAPDGEDQRLRTQLAEYLRLV